MFVLLFGFTETVVALLTRLATRPHRIGIGEERISLLCRRTGNSADRDLVGEFLGSSEGIVMALNEDSSCGLIERIEFLDIGKPGPAGGVCAYGQTSCRLARSYERESTVAHLGDEPAIESSVRAKDHGASVLPSTPPRPRT